MKSIEEAAIEHAGKTWPISQVDEWDSNELKLFCKKDFQAGVEFAQRWIDVNDELPESFTSVLVRDNECSPIRSTALYMDGLFHPDFVLTHKQVTHWRPIEYK